MRRACMQAPTTCNLPALRHQPNHRHAHSVLTNSTPWAAPLVYAGTTRTFYIYHIMMDGSNSDSTMSLGPQRMLPGPFKAGLFNPGIVVESFADQGDKVPYQLAITLRYIGKQAITQTNFTLKQGTVPWPVPLQFHLNVGVRPI